jgi:hypothetical protein
MNFFSMPQRITLFIFLDDEQATVIEGLPNCLQHAVFMPRTLAFSFLKMR